MEEKYQKSELILKSALSNGTILADMKAPTYSLVQKFNPKDQIPKDFGKVYEMLVAKYREDYTEDQLRSKLYHVLNVMCLYPQ